MTLLSYAHRTKCTKKFILGNNGYDETLPPAMQEGNCLNNKSIQMTVHSSVPFLKNQSVHGNNLKV